MAEVKQEKARDAFYTWRSQPVIDEMRSGLSSCSYIVVYDLETTGFDPLSDRVIELAAIRYKVDLDRLIEDEKLHQYIRLPDQMHLPQEIIELTGITKEQLNGAPFEDECFERILFFFERTPVAGYNNNSFDNRFMRQLYYRNAAEFIPERTFDVLEMAHDFIPSEEVEDFKLASVAQYSQIMAEQYHSAFSDAEVTGALLKKFLEYYRMKETVSFSGTERPRIIDVSDWRKEGLERIYVNMDCLKVYYDVRRRTWYSQSNRLDMKWLEEQAWKIVGAANDREFSLFRGKVTT